LARTETNGRMMTNLPVTLAKDRDLPIRMDHDSDCLGLATCLHRLGLMEQFQGKVWQGFTCPGPRSSFMHVTALVSLFVLFV
jgi:hypothetical protein